MTSKIKHFKTINIYIQIFLSKFDVFNLLILSLITLIFSYLVVYFFNLYTILGTNVKLKINFH